MPLFSVSLKLLEFKEIFYLIGSHKKINEKGKKKEKFLKLSHFLKLTKFHLLFTARKKLKVI